MLSDKFKNQIHLAYEQCVANFEQSPWGDRLFCYHASLEEFT